MAEIIRFSLSQDFREPFRIDAPRRKYIGRVQEFSRLKNLIRARSAANILVSGLRGTGKSSYVNEALRQLKEAGEKIVVVDTSLAHIPESEQADLGGYTLKSLIRGLYFALKADGETSDDLEDLYEKTYFTALQAEKTLELAKADTTEKAREVSESKKITYSFSIDTRALKGLFSLAYLGVGVKLSDTIFASTWHYIGYFAPLMLVVLVPIKFGTEKTSKGTETEKTVHVTDQKSKRAGIGSLDLSSQTLEIVLKQELKRLEKDRKKIVFVLDELDKLQGGSEGIYKIVESLKNLFTLSSAIFIFITDESFFDNLDAEKNDTPYSSHHTLFTDVIFLPNMDYSDISELIDNFKTGKLERGSRETYDQFKLYIGWKTFNHVFDVHSHIDRFAVFDNKGEAHISVREDEEFDKGNLDSNWKTLAAMQLVVTKVLRDHYYPNNPRLNEKLFLTLREVAQKLCESGSVSVTGDDYLALVDKSKLKIDKLTGEELKDFDGPVQDMLDRMHRLDNFVTETSPQENEVQYNLSSKPDFPSEESLTNRREILDFEQAFLDSHEEISRLYRRIKASGLSLFEPHEKEIESWNKMSRSIRNKVSRRARKSVVQSSTEKINEILKPLAQNVLFNIVSTVEGKYENVVFTSLQAGVDNRPLTDSDPTMAAFYTALSERGENSHRVLYNPTKPSVCIIVGFDLPRELQDIFLSVKVPDRASSFPRVYNITYDSDIDNRGRQQHWQRRNLNRNYTNIYRVVHGLESMIEYYL